jgi:hypothetical protein
MSTEQKPPATNVPHPTHSPTEPKAEPNALARALTGGWEKFKQGKLLSYPMMALILLIVTGIGLTWWIVRERRGAESARWTKFDGLSSISSLEEFVKENPDTKQAKLANLEIARAQLGQEGIEKLNALDPLARKNAVANVEKAREAFAKLVDEFKDDPVIKVECMLACAKAEAVLVGMPKEGQLEQRRGDPAKAIEWLDKVAEAAPETDWGKDAKKLADTLRNQNTQQQVVTLQAMVYDISPALPKGPSIPGLPPGLGGPPGDGFPIPPFGP